MSTENYKKWTKVIEWSDEDNCYIGSLPGCIFGEGKCCHGSTEEEVLKELQEIAKELCEH